MNFKQKLPLFEFIATTEKLAVFNVIMAFSKFISMTYTKEVTGSH